MAAQTLSANSRNLRIHGGNIQPNLAPVFWAAVVIGMGAVLVGLWGAMTMASLQSTGTVVVHGMADGVFEKLVFGGLLLSSLGAFGLFRSLGRRSSV